MDTFDDIRPYRDDELADRIAALVKNPALIRSTCQLKFPRWFRFNPSLVQLLVGVALRVKSRRLTSLSALHNVLAGYVEHVVRTTTDGFSYTGVELLPQDEPVIFISNHRDIALDSILVNYALWLNDFPTTQIAVGDNLFGDGFETELMRINRSFVVIRSAEGMRAQYQALSRTSRYIRHTLEQGESIWIAQREGRAKDGLDRTDPAILKMFMLAFRDEASSIEEWLSRVNLVPTTLSYELDPCAPSKAVELHERDSFGQYKKQANEDRESMIAGITGFKGRVHVAFSQPLSGPFDSPESLGQKIDESIVNNIRQFDSFRHAKELLESENPRSLLTGRVDNEFRSQLDSVSVHQRPFLLRQYANQVRD